MYEYKFVKLDLKPGFLQMKPKGDYHAMIEHHADEGWRLLQIFAPNASAHANASFFELIFERPKAAMQAAPSETAASRS